MRKLLDQRNIHMKTDLQKMQRRIMRRVYYTFGIRLATHTLTLHVVVLGAAMYGVGYFVHVAAVMQNMARIPTGEIAPWLMHAVSNTEGITLLVLGAAILSLLSLPIQLPQYKRSLHKGAQTV
jgi:hypothetical protein